MFRALRLILLILFYACARPVHGAGPQVLFYDGFEAGPLDTNRWTVRSLNDGQAIVTTNFAPAAGNAHLLLQDAVSDDIYSRVTATFSLNVHGYTNLLLT